MKFIVKDRGFYKTLLAMALPIALQNLISFGASMTDTIMVGVLGDTILSAAYLANQPFFLIMILVFGLSSGGAVLIAQYWGRKNTEAVRRIMGMSMRFVMVAVVVFSGVCMLFPTWVMSLFSSEAAVVEQAAQYLRIVAISYIPFGVTSCYLYSLRAVENVKLSAIINGVSFVIDTACSYVFIFGKLGFAKQGIAGAALGTAIGRFVELAIVLFYILKIEKKIKFSFKNVFRRERELLADYIRHSTPVVGSELGWSLAIVTQAAIIGNLGQTFTAAYSIVSVLQQLAMVALLGVGNAAAVLVGKAVGAGKIEESKNMSKTLLVISFGVGLVSCGTILALRNVFTGIYNVSPETRELAVQLMGLMAVMILFMAVEAVSFIGILRGAGDTKYCMILDIACSWLVGVPMGYLAGYVWRLPIFLVYICLRSDIPLRMAGAVLRIFKGDYAKNLTRDM